MPQETVGYVELEWTCRNCGSKNKGMIPKCTTCGAPMPESAEFELPAQQELITDQGKLEQAKQSADQTCPFCGTRNPAAATQCKMCQGPLEAARVLAAGQVLGAFQDKPQPDIVCPSCGVANPATALKCKNCGSSLSKPQRLASAPATTVQPPSTSGRRLGVAGISVAVIAFLALCAAGLYVFNLAGRTTSVVASPIAVEWERSISIQEQQLVKRTDWEDQLPRDAQKLSCRREVRGTQDAPGPNTEKVCGTPYVVNQGTGAGKVVQDCNYNVMANRCEFNVLEWRAVDPVVLRAANLEPQWPSLTLKQNQRESPQNSRAEKYTVKLAADGRTYSYQSGDAAEFARFTSGSRWALEVNGLGGVNKVEPAR